MADMKRAGFIRTGGARGNSRSMVVTYKGRQYSKALPATVTKQRAIDKALTAFVAEVQSGAFAKVQQQKRALSAAPTFQEAMDHFMAHHMPMDADGQSKRHAYAYGLGLLAKALGDRRVGDIGEEDLRRLFRELRAKPLSVATLRVVYAVATRFFRQLAKQGTIPTNPLPTFGDMELGHGEAASERARRAALSDAQVAGLLSACTEPGLRLWATIMAATGMRPGEALGLRWRDIGPRAATISGSVKSGLIRGQGRLGSTKSRKPRTIPIAPELAGLLAAERQRQETLLHQLGGSDLAPDDFVFPVSLEARGHPMSLETMRARFRAAAQRSGLKGVTPHWLRHTNASAMLAGTDTEPGISIVDAAALLGHANPLTTARTYAHASQANMRRGATLSARLITVPVADQ